MPYLSTNRSALIASAWRSEIWSGVAASRIGVWLGDHECRALQHHRRAGRGRALHPMAAICVIHASRSVDSRSIRWSSTIAAIFVLRARSQRVAATASFHHGCAGRRSARPRSVDVEGHGQRLLRRQRADDLVLGDVGQRGRKENLRLRRAFLTETIMPRLRRDTEPSPVPLRWLPARFNVIEIGVAVLVDGCLFSPALPQGFEAAGLHQKDHLHPYSANSTISG